MKNKIIIALIFILPFLVYGFIQGTKNTENLKNTASALENRVIVYKFYSPMCKDCLVQAKEIEKIKGQLPREVYIEEINVSENTDKNQNLIEQFNILTVPSTVIVDNSGKIRKKTVGIINSNELMTEINTVLGEK